MTELILIALVFLTIVNLILTIRNAKNGSLKPEELTSLKSSVDQFKFTLESSEKIMKDEFQRSRTEFNSQSKGNREELSNSLKSFEDKFGQNTKDMNELIRQKFSDFGNQQSDLNKTSEGRLKEIRETIEKQLKDIREDNEKQLSLMRDTVDEKLQTTLEKRLGESFKQVSERLEQVHKGLGEMQNIATGVGDLKKVLSNVKTRGVMGEYQLENILEQILTPDQYSKNVATKKGSQAHVEFAIKLPGKSSDEEVWLPIDSKFPIESYHYLLDAYEKGEKDEIEKAQKTFVKTIEKFAKDISERYVDPPHTTDFALMFLPVESLYAEVLRHPGLMETLQTKYRVSIAGPTTLSAFLNSLQMGFRTLAVQKRSSEVWKILEAVKAEFGKYSDQLEKVDKQLVTASKSLGELRNTRTNVLSRKLNDVATIDVGEEPEILLEISKKAI